MTLCRRALRRGALAAVLAVTAGLPACGVPARATAPAAPPVAGTTVERAAPWPGSAAPTAAGIPAGLLLPDEGTRSTSVDVTDWATDATRTRPWLLDPCRPTAYPTDARRVDFRTVSRSGPELFDARQLAAYPTPEVAAEVVAGFRRALAACRTGGDAAQGRRWRYAVLDPVDVGDDGFLAASTTGGPTFSPAGERLAVTRVGALVFLAYGTGEYATAEVDEGARSAERVARRFVADR